MRVCAYPGPHGGRGPQAEGGEVALPRQPRERHLHQAIGKVSETVQRGSNINLFLLASGGSNFLLSIHARMKGGGHTQAWQFQLRKVSTTRAGIISREVKASCLMRSNGWPLPHAESAPQCQNRFFCGDGGLVYSLRKPPPHKQ